MLESGDAGGIARVCAGSAATGEEEKWNEETISHREKIANFPAAFHTLNGSIGEILH
jgi:hypothetical protein